MRRLLVVKTGEALPQLVAERGSYDDWIVRGLGLTASQVEVVTVYEGEPLPAPGELSGVVVTGSAAMVSEREPWSVRTGEWLANAVPTGLPVLGICFGHQLLAQALGGRVGRNPRGREMGTVLVHLHPDADSDPLLARLPAQIQVHATHVESVLSLPPGARLLASSDTDPHQMFALGPAAWGVQFHPEFDAEVIREYIETRRDELVTEGRDVAAMLASVEASDVGDVLLRRFARLLRA